MPAGNVGQFWIDQYPFHRACIELGAWIAEQAPLVRSGAKPVDCATTSRYSPGTQPVLETPNRTTPSSVPAVLAPEGPAGPVAPAGPVGPSAPGAPVRFQTSGSSCFLQSLADSTTRILPDFSLTHPTISFDGSPALTMATPPSATANAANADKKITTDRRGFMAALPVLGAR